MLRASLALWVAVLVAGCGGGGGGGSDSPAAPPPATSIVPPPPARGATLHVDATVLRPARSGATWTYRGQSSSSSEATPVVYRTETTQLATATGVDESATNSGAAGPASARIRIANGTIGYLSLFDFAGKGQIESVEFVELRSPVVQGDQYTIFDHHYADTDIDADGDMKPDALDVGIYARVVGQETLTLPNLPSLAAVRVDTTLALRLQASSTGEFSPVFRATVSTWYAKGIGPVRQLTQTPTPDGGDTAVTDELLVAWDGLSEGFGAMASTSAVVPASNPVLPGATLPGGLQGFIRAFGFDDQALVFSRSVAGSSGIVVSRLDLRGRVIDAQLHESLALNDRTGSLVMHPAGVLYLEPLSSSNTAQVALTGFDRNGNLMGAPGAVSIDLGGGRFVPTLQRFSTATDGATLWILWARSYVQVGQGFVNELVLQAFDTAGNPLAPETVVDAGPTLVFALTAGSGKVLLNWVRPSPAGTFDVLYAIGSVSSGSLDARSLVTGLPASNVFVAPFLLPEGGALLWPSALGSGAVLPATAGVRLDGSYAVLRSASGGLDAELLAGVSTYDSNTPAPAAVGPRIVMSATVRGNLWPDEPGNEQNLHVVNWFDAGSGPLASTPVRTVRSEAGDLGQSFAQLVWPDRTMLFGGDYQLKTTVVWTNGGN
ncbi:MAG: hypothetical protein ABI671_01090 [Burkholderiales bacterium]